MSFIKFLFSKSFLKQLVLAIILIVALCFAYLYWLSYYTNHDQHITVPNLSRLTLDQASKKLKESDLRMRIIDSTNYNPGFPPKTIIEQEPLAGKFVKENRQIYIKVNPSGYGKVLVPNLVNKTRRQVEPSLKALKFKIGKITKRAHIATDMVLELRHNGKKIEPGTQLTKTSVIDLVVGDESLLKSIPKTESTQTTTSDNAE